MSLKFSMFLSLSIFSQQLNPVLCSPGHEGVLPGYSGTLHPLSNFPGGPSLLRTQKHALLGYIKCHTFVFSMHVKLLHLCVVVFGHQQISGSGS